jgi:MarR family transcriptional regulator, organic hydroperoxide resistance regulator
MTDSKTETIENVDKRAAGRFADAWDEFVLAVRRAQARNPQSPEDLTLAQYYLLRPLEREARLPSCQLAEWAGIAAPTATRMVDGLQKSGLIRRERSESDRRTVLVSLTDAGRSRVARKRHQLARRRRRAYENLEPDEREQGERLLRHLAELVGQL